MSSNNEIVKRILELIAEKGYKPTPLMNELGMGQGTINQFSKAKNLEKNIKINRICEFLGANRNYILTGDGDKFISSKQPDIRAQKNSLSN